MEDIATEAVRFYKVLFGFIDPEVHPDKPSLESLVLQRLSEEQKVFLCQEFTTDDVRQVVMGMSSHRAPGPDGYSAGFYKRTWGIVGEDITSGILQFFSIGKLPSSINSTAVSLIPKVASACRLKEFRPISCVNIIYKIIAKLLANRLKKVLATVVSGNQSAFIEGRRIVDNILMAQELVSGYHKITLSSRCAIKVDLMKAFDSVHWGYLFLMMDVMGFPSRFIYWIRLCIKTAKFSICINGGLCGFFGAQRGVRQGDPLSPYLFTIAMEGLSLLLNRAAAEGTLPFHPQCKRVGLTHLCFADDLLIFTEGSGHAIHRVQEILKEFHSISGLKCNPSKCEVYFGGKSVLFKQATLQISGFAEGELPVRYLGVPLLSGKLPSSETDKLVAIITKKIQSWRAKKLSYAGRLQLISSVLMGTLQYWMQIFILPKKVIKQVQMLCSRFLWHGGEEGRAKVGWDKMARPRGEGGLGLRDLCAWNRACTVRFLWLFLMKSGAIWVAWFQHYKVKNRSIWTVSDCPSSSWAWRRILKLRGMIQPLLMLHNSQIMWDNKPMPVFKVSVVWNTLRVKHAEVVWGKLVWGKNYVPRNSFLTWMVMLDGMVTKQKLLTWGKQTDGLCVLCGNAIETREHLFFACGFSNQVVRELQMGVLCCRSWEDTVTVGIACCKRPRMGRMTSLIWCLCCAGIWKERCRRLYGNVRKPMEDFVRELKSDLRVICADNDELLKGLQLLGLQGSIV
ncbi:unnamed protein product [Linum trigynum]|uniref:Reverse transcriptase domain-containing protein n=1 Tax=Linum trigynum TaxID=586398 RepID=A0AAV2CI14_9ROSI